MEEEYTQNINPSTPTPRRNNLSSNTESNPREQLNAITIQDEEGLVEPEPELRQGIMASKDKGETDQNEQKSETRSKSIHEPCSSINKGPIYEEQRLQIEELDEWRTQKPRAHDRPKPRHDELNVSPNQLKVGDKVLLDAADLHIATSEPNGTIPLKVLSIFPYGTVEVIHPKFSPFKVNRTCLKPYFEFDSRNEECTLLAPP
ncbi:hypothetical protein GOBAR_AA31437 [Gossypium barbadense]|uniref:Uncharacterized protein n=1 Tax=Gossypium barbadense TaxID=3634 RepID=A0A2P5WDW2_GOSBA|nr:hypothetical protein GOBAR_AA31437 [Gossypium barbadense]